MPNAGFSDEASNKYAGMASAGLKENNSYQLGPFAVRTPE